VHWSAEAAGIAARLTVAMAEAAAMASVVRFRLLLTVFRVLPRDQLRSGAAKVQAGPYCVSGLISTRNRPFGAAGPVGHVDRLKAPEPF
jgi:hypothetical protein